MSSGWARRAETGSWRFEIAHPGGQLVEVWRFNERMAVAAKAVVEIVRHHEHDVRARGSVRRSKGEKDSGGEKGWESHSAG